MSAEKKLWSKSHDKIFREPPSLPPHALDSNTYLISSSDYVQLSHKLPNLNSTKQNHAEKIVIEPLQFFPSLSFHTAACICSWFCFFQPSKSQLIQDPDTSTNCTHKILLKIVVTSIFSCNSIPCQVLCAGYFYKKETIYQGQYYNP